MLSLVQKNEWRLNKLSLSRSESMGFFVLSILYFLSVDPMACFSRAGKIERYRRDLVRDAKMLSLAKSMRRTKPRE